MLNWNGTFGGAMGSIGSAPVPADLVTQLDRDWEFAGEVNQMRAYRRNGRAVCFLEWRDPIQRMRNTSTWRIFAGAETATGLEQTAGELGVTFEGVRTAVRCAVVPEVPRECGGGCDPAPEGREGSGLEVARTSAASKGNMDPIGLEEWSAYVQSDPTMIFAGPREGRNPFTGERMVLKSRPGAAVWEPPTGGQVRLRYRHGRVTMEGSGPDRVAKMKEVACALKARLFDSSGEEIPVR